MVAAIAVASAGLGMLVGVAMASRSFPEGGASSQCRPGGPALPWGGGAPRCATCGGSGKEECRLCARWSDARAGGGGHGGSRCGACAGTLRAPCSSCGGGGSGRRAPVRVAAAGARAPLPIVRSR